MLPRARCGHHMRGTAGLQEICGRRRIHIRTTIWKHRAVGCVPFVVSFCNVARETCGGRVAAVPLFEEQVRDVLTTYLLKEVVHFEGRSIMEFVHFVQGWTNPSFKIAGSNLDPRLAYDPWWLVRSL